MSVAVALISFGLTRNYLLRQRESSAVRQTRANARLVASTLGTPQPEILRLLTSLETSAGTSPLVFFSGRWFGTGLAVDPDRLPRDLLRLALDERVAAHQRSIISGERAVAVALPLADGGAYVEVFPLGELERTLSTLGGALVVAALLTTAMAAVLGWWASGRVLRPVTSIDRAAAAVAGGDLGTRLDRDGYRELDVLVASFNDMVGALQRRIEQDSRFASAVSHELRSPLTTLRSAAEVLEARRTRMDARTARAVTLVVDEVARFERLVTDLLEISRYRAGGEHLSVERVLLGDLVRHAVGGAGATVPVEVDDDARALAVEVDKRRIERVVGNLLENADRYGGGAVRVHVSVHDGSGRIAVEDAGPGVPEEDRLGIFEWFARGRAARWRAGGTGVGLGLSLVAEHVTLHGGRVWVEDRDGGGARFVVELPGAT